MLEIQSESWKLEVMIIPSTSRGIHTILHSKSPTSHPHSNENRNRITDNHNAISHTRHKTAYLINVGVLLVLLVQECCCKQKKWERLLWRIVRGSKRYHCRWSARWTLFPFLFVLHIVPQAQHSTLRDQLDSFEVEPVSKELKIERNNKNKQPISFWLLRTSHACYHPFLYC